jgi:hypothetical protein
MPRHTPLMSGHTAPLCAVFGQVLVFEYTTVGSLTAAQHTAQLCLHAEFIGSSALQLIVHLTHMTAPNAKAATRSSTVQSYSHTGTAQPYR